LHVVKYVLLRILLRGNFDRYPLNAYIVRDKMCVNSSLKNLIFLYVCSAHKQQHAAIGPVYWKEMQCDRCVQNIESLFLF
jgi:hypothetical protein